MYGKLSAFDRNTSRQIQCCRCYMVYMHLSLWIKYCIQELGNLLTCIVLLSLAS